MNPAPTPFTIRWTGRGYVVSRPDIDEAEVVLASEHQAALAAKDAEIARLRDTLVACVEQRDRHWQSLKVETARAEKAEAELREAKLLCVRQLLTIQELRAEVERLKAELSEANRRVAVEQSCVSKEAFKVKELRAALAAAKEDTRRIDWLEQEQGSVSRDNFGRAHVGHGRMLIWKTGDTLRAAIDAARKATP